MFGWHWRAALRALWGIKSPSAGVVAYQQGYRDGIESVRHERAALKAILRTSAPPYRW